MILPGPSPQFFFCFSLAAASAFAQQYPAQQTNDDYSKRPPVMAQAGDPQQPSGGDLSQVQPNGYPQDPQGSYPQGPQNNYPAKPAQGGYSQTGGYGQAGGYPRFPALPAQQGQMSQGPQRPYIPVPDTVNIPSGKYIDVRVDNYLSTDHNQAGDGFTATLVEPLVVDGVVVAQAGQRVSGRVVESEKAGRVKGLSHLRLELTEINLVDGQQLPIKTSLTNRRGNTSYGRDAFGIGATTLAGAAIGAGVNGGVGAGVGAAAGLVVGTLGVLFTRGEPTVIGPESLLTFRIENPIAISTVRSPGAFHIVSRQDYAQSRGEGFPPRPGPYGYPPVATRPYYPYPYYGPAFFVGGPAFYYRGYYRRW